VLPEHSYLVDLDRVEVKLLTLVPVLSTLKAVLVETTHLVAVAAVKLVVLSLVKPEQLILAAVVVAPLCRQELLVVTLEPVVVLADMSVPL